MATKGRSSDRVNGTSKQPAQPQAEQYEIMRLSENGDGFILWGHQTHHDWETVLRPAYFRAPRIKTKLNLHDRIEVTSGDLGETVTHGTLVVRHAAANGDISVAVLNGPVVIDTIVDSPFDMLGLNSDASASDVEAAFRQRSKKLHPDAGGDEQAFQRLCWAREECLKRCPRAA